MTYTTKLIIYYIERTTRLIFLLSFLLSIILYFVKDRYPKTEIIDSRIYSDPIQTKIEQNKIEESSEGKSYTITKLYDYDISGVVVSLHNSGSWIDYYHRRYGDMFNIKDICLVWGENVKSEVYKKLKFESGDFTCAWGSDSEEDYQKFNPEQISNNHILSLNPNLKKILLSVNRGDQIRLKGYLANYSNQDFSRNTSISRNDIGNGACEIIYIDDIEILAKSYPEYDFAFQLFKYITILSLIIYVPLFLLFPNHKPIKELEVKRDNTFKFGR